MQLLVPRVVTELEAFAKLINSIATHTKKGETIYQTNA